MTEKLTYEKAVELAKKAVEAKGADYVYHTPEGERAVEATRENDWYSPDCVNFDVDSDCPSCIVGHILFDFGVPKDELIEFNEEGSHEFVEWYASRQVDVFLEALQRKQDAGLPWGQALEEAIAESEEWAVENPEMVNR